VRILIIGINYAPEPTGSAPYTSGLAQILSELGHSVEVMAGIPHYPDWKVRPEYKFRLRRKDVQNGVCVTHLRHFVPRKQTTIRRIVWEVTFLINALCFKPTNKPELVVSSTPSLSGGILGIYFGFKHKIPIVSIIQDLVGNGITQSGLTKGDIVSKFVSKIEKFIYRNSSKVCIVSKQFQGFLKQLQIHENAIFFLPNWTHISNPTKTKEESRRHYGWAASDFIVLHTGNMGLKQGLENVINTAKALVTASNIKFVLSGDGSQKAELIKKSVGIGNVLFIDVVPEDEYPNLLLAADLLLVNQQKTIGDMSLPSKLTSYFTIGRPVVAAVNEFGACAHEISATLGAGEIVEAENPYSLAKIILKLSQDPERLQYMGRAAKKYAETNLSRDIAKERVSTLIKLFSW